MNREQKKEFVTSFSGHLQSCEMLIVAQQSGLNAAQTFAFRCAVRQVGGYVRVVKNSLARLSGHHSGREQVVPFVKGPVGFITGNDPVALAKVVVEFAKKSGKLRVLAGHFEGRLLQANDVQRLSDIPSLDQLRAQLLNLFQGPARQFLFLLQQPGTMMVRVLGARAKEE